MRILIVSDAWYPQVNGVVRALDTTRAHAEAAGHTVEVIGPDRFRTVAAPTYPEIRLALRPRGTLARLVEAFVPDAIHVATEGPLGWAARAYCRRHGLPFTTSWHTMFPHYVRARFGVPLAWTFAFLRRFHRAGTRIMVTTPTMEAMLGGRGFRRIVRWRRGVDLDLFRPRDKGFLDFPRPIFVFVGRVAVEKNLDAFLSLELPGTKMVVGDGPQAAELRRRYPDVRFVGVHRGENLARHYAAADCFVFPSRTDTFGLVLLEALASGIPVAAFPVQGPLDVIGDAPVGVLSEDLRDAALRALEIPADRCRSYAEGFSWAAATREFVGHLEPFGRDDRDRRNAEDDLARRLADAASTARTDDAA